MKSRSPEFSQISKIISISNDYLTHRKNLTKVKGLVDHSSPNRNHDVSDYLHRKAHYRQRYQSQANHQLQKDNEKIVARITNISEQRVGDSRASSRSCASHRTLTQQVSAAKTRRNFMKANQLKKQNEKMDQRVRKSHFKDSFSPKGYQRTETQRKQYKEICSKYSPRGRSQILSALKKVDCKPRELPFLPHLPSRRHSKHNF